MGKELMLIRLNCREECRGSALCCWGQFPLFLHLRTLALIEWSLGSFIIVVGVQGSKRKKMAGLGWSRAMGDRGKITRSPWGQGEQTQPESSWHETTFAQRVLTRKHYQAPSVWTTGGVLLKNSELLKILPHWMLWKDCFSVEDPATPTKDRVLYLGWWCLSSRHIKKTHSFLG